MLCRQVSINNFQIKPIFFGATRLKFSLIDGFVELHEGFRKVRDYLHLDVIIMAGKRVDFNNISFTFCPW